MVLQLSYGIFLKNLDVSEHGFYHGHPPNNSIFMRRVMSNKFHTVSTKTKKKGCSEFETSMDSELFTKNDGP